jgi:integrase
VAKVLTAAAVGRLRAETTRREVPDAAAPGLYLIVQPSGAKSWALRYRRPDGRPAKLVLGSVFDAADKEPDTAPVIGGHLTLAAARRLATALRHEIAQGRDPAADYLTEKRRRSVAAAERASNTFAAAARDFVEQYARPKVRRWKEIARLLGFEPTPEGLEVIRKGLADRWRDKPLVEITGHDIHSLIVETRERGAPGLVRRAEGPTETRARAMLSCLSKMFRWLVQHRRVEVNPCAGVHRPSPPRSRERVLTNAEIVKFWTATEILGAPFGPAARLLLITGARLNEVAGMRRSELGDDATWNVPGQRTKNHRPLAVPLPPLAREIVAGLPPRGDLIFSTNGRTPISGWSKTKARLDKAMNVPAWRLHDLRRTAATGMAEIGIAPHIIEACLNHVSGSKANVAGVYNRFAYGPEKKAALERWADYVAGLVCGRAAKVVPMRGSAS